MPARKAPSPTSASRGDPRAARAGQRGFISQLHPGGLEVKLL